MKNLFVSLLALLISVAGYSQEMAAKKLTNPKWKQVVMVKFHPGKYDRAMTIIRDYFEKASQKSNTPGPEVALRMTSGEYDMMLVWGLKNGVEDLNWEMHPDDVAWMKALGEVAGSAEKGNAVFNEYLGLIATSNVQLARVP